MASYLLDTHALIWASYAPSLLGVAGRRAIENGSSQVFVSAISAFEIANKHRLGKLDEARTLAADFSAVVLALGFSQLPVTIDHARLGGELAIAHRDPFDRMLIAQAQMEQLVLVSNEKLFDDFGVIRLW